MRPSNSSVGSFLSVRSAAWLTPLVAAMVAAACSSTPASPGDAPDGGQDANVVDTGVTEPDGAIADAGRTDARDADAIEDASANDATLDAAPDVFDAGFDAGTPAVRFVGRFDDRIAGEPRFAYQGSRFIARFMGTDATVTLRDTAGFSGGPSYFDVFVDGVAQAPLALMAGVNTYPVATGLAAGVHTVELYKRTEPNLGVVGFMGFDFPGGGMLLPPPATPTRRIEVLSDSTVNGYGMLGAGPNCPGGAPPETHSSRGSMPQMVADTLGADLHLLAYSGKGITKNSFAGDTNVFGQFYGRALPDDGASTWTFSRWVPDVIISVVGGVDYSLPTAADRPTFETQYNTLVGRMRTNYPNAHIILAVGPQLNNDYPVGFNTRTNIQTTMQNIVNNRTAGGDTRIHFFAFTAINDPALQTGCYYHANATLHQQMATAITPFIRSKTGW